MSEAQRFSRVPKEVDKDVPIMFFEPMEFVAFIGILGFGMIFNLFFLGVVAGVGYLMVSRKMKRGAKRGASQHFLYRLGLPLDPALKKYFPSPSLSEFIE